MQADLSKPETIPATLVGVHTVIDCATGRPEEPIKTVNISLPSSFRLIDIRDVIDHLAIILHSCVIHLVPIVSLVYSDKHLNLS